MNNTNDHAEVGALLAKCCYFEGGQDCEEWWAMVGVLDKGGFFRGYGPTQLAAIRAAVEAAEKWVRDV